jgi:nucleoside-diphosphate-sugar epimerase
LKSKKTLIIGGSGFVGSRLIEELGENNCINLDKKESPFYNKNTFYADITKPETININKNIRSIVLLAAEHKDNILPITDYYDVNVTGTKNVLEKMDKVGIKQLVFTSSVAVYGLNKNNPSENHAHDPFNDYGKSKSQAEQLIIKWYNREPKNKSVTIIRPTVIFGERNRGNVYNLLKYISSGKFIMVGKGENKKSMAYVGNVAAFIKDRLNKKRRCLEIFNYADGKDLNMSELVSLVENELKIKNTNLKIPYIIAFIGASILDFLSKVFRTKFQISSVRIKKFCAKTQYNSNKAHKVFNTKYTLEEGLKRTIQFEFKNSRNDNDFF